MTHVTQGRVVTTGGTPKVVRLAAILLGTTVMSVAIAHHTGIGAQTRPSPSPVANVSLQFADRPDGSIAITKANGGELIYLVAPGSDGFIRGTMRGFARERRLNDVGAKPPFRLTRWSDGTLSLQDDATGRHIDLDAFGPTNAMAFAVLMKQGGNSK